MGLVENEQDGEGAEPGDGWKCPETCLFLHTHSVPCCASCSRGYGQEELQLFVVWL